VGHAYESGRLVARQLLVDEQVPPETPRIRQDANGITVNGRGSIRFNAHRSGTPPHWREPGRRQPDNYRPGYVRPDIAEGGSNSASWKKPRENREDPDRAPPPRRSLRERSPRRGSRERYDSSTRLNRPPPLSRDLFAPPASYQQMPYSYTTGNQAEKPAGSPDGGRGVERSKWNSSPRDRQGRDRGRERERSPRRNRSVSREKRRSVSPLRDRKC